jgi:hypothetical protein
MKLNFIKLLFAFFFVTAVLNSHAQTSRAKQVKNIKNHPTTFLITKAEFDDLFAGKINEPVRSSSNKYLNKSVLLMNTLNGDMKFLKLKLDYFKNAFLMVQVNGEYSTQIFILSEDKSVFYKGRIEKDNVLMTKCNEDDIVSE